jgi:hypothetical protein
MTTSGWFKPATPATPAWFKSATPVSVEAAMMAEYLMDAEVGSVAHVTRRPVTAYTVKMSGADLAEFEADRRQQVLHDRIAELRRRAQR